MTTPGGPSVCLLANRELRRWQIDALETVSARTDAEVGLVVVDDGTGTGGDVENADYATAAVDDPRRLGADDLRLLGRLFREEGRWALTRLLQKAGWLLTGPDERWRMIRSTPVEEVDVLDGADVVSVTPRTDGNWNELPPDAVERVADYDVAVRFGFGLLSGAVLEAPTHGVVSFHPADVRRYRGQGPEQIFYRGRDSCGVTLQVLDESIDAGEVVLIADVDLSDVHTYGDVWGRILRRQSEVLAEGIERLTGGDAPRDVEPGPYYSHDGRERPVFLARFLLKDLRGHVRKHLR